LCGTPEYLAPEIIQNKGHNKAVDWWALGILIYEMLVGYPPFFDDNPFKIYDRILEGKISWSKHTDPVAKDLIKKLLVQDRTRRLGNMKNGAADVKSHRWFRKVNWDDVYNRKLDPPIVPRVRHHGDARNFYDYPEQNWQKWYELQEDPGCPPSDGLSFADQSSRDLAPPPVPENSVNWSTSSSSFSGSRPPQGTSNSDLRIFEDF
jgi:protein kinase X